MSDEDFQEKRHFSRILFNETCTLQQEGETWTTSVIDISLKGLMVQKPAGFSLGTNQRFTARIHLGESNQFIEMTLIFAHEENEHLGFCCEHISIDSMAHLKRLVELNLADETLLHRELSALSRRD